MKKLNFSLPSFIFFLILVSCSKPSFSQQKEIDSLQKLIQRDKEDSSKVIHLNSLARQYISTGTFDSAFVLAQSALKLSLTIKPANKKRTAGLYNMLGAIFSSQGNSPEALKNYFLSLKLREETKDNPGIATLYNNIGIAYNNQRNYNEALKNYSIALKMTRELEKQNPGDKENKGGLANLYNNIAGVYFQFQNYAEALKNYQASIKLQEEINDQQGVAMALGNMGGTYEKMGDYDLASKNLEQSLKIYRELGDKYGRSITLLIRADMETKLAALKRGHESNLNLKMAENDLNEALKITKEIGTKEVTKDVYDALSRVDSIRKNYKGAYENHLLFIAYKDSLINEDSRKKMIQGQMTYEFEKKEATAKIAEEKRAAIAAAESHKQRLFIWFIAAIALVVAIVAVVIFRTLRITRDQKSIIEQKNILITDSIEYASNIQNAILPSEELIKQQLPESFILYLPKDIVSGDFYWLNPESDGTLIAAVDCTGHGVPGAFMSVMAYNMLENIVKEKKLIQPAAILDVLNTTVVETLHQESETASAKYGMDIALLRIDKNLNQAQYAAAHNALYIVRDEKLIEVKANKTTIGMAREKFTDHTIEIIKGDMLYLFTDGYADQKGGPENKKLFAVDFKELFLAISKKNIAEQKQVLEKTFVERRGHNEQLDDVLVIGIRV